MTASTNPPDKRTEKEKAQDAPRDAGGAAEPKAGSPETVQEEHRRGDAGRQSDWARSHAERNVPGAASQPRPAHGAPPDSAGIPKGGRTKPR